MEKGIILKVQKAILLASQHWGYIDDILEKHEVWTHGYKVEYQTAYLCGFVYGYIDIDYETPDRPYAAASILDLLLDDEKRTVTSLKNFHCTSAYKHGRKHRKQDDEKEKAEKNEA